MKRLAMSASTGGGGTQSSTLRGFCQSNEHDLGIDQNNSTITNIVCARIEKEVKVKSLIKELKPNINRVRLVGGNDRRAGLLRLKPRNDGRFSQPPCHPAFTHHVIAHEVSQSPRAKNRPAFTLAEVLITLGIIGIVAAMTLPALIQKQNEKETIVKLKKTYSLMSQAFLRAVEDNGTPDNWDLQASYSPVGAENMANMFAKYLKVTKNCGREKGCLTEGGYKRLNGLLDTNFDLHTGYAKMVLADGSAVFFTVRSEDCTQDRGSGILHNVCGVVYVDTNGVKQPNQYGKDLFAFVMSKAGIVPNGASEDTLTNFNTCNTSNTGYGCTAWVIFNENMDYLYCPDKLGWNRAKSCKE